ncbi:MAG: SigB/SigF/SigG family RNA polymerase sigma factor [Ruminococcus sp.]|nr:SigB/SigF/SigG family RNA polymerase sigma factor [Ruminococcus sp.]
MQYNKVEISGVNTSELITLTEKEKTELLKKARAGDKAARERLIKGNLRLVLSVLQRFAGRCSQPDDLFQVGVIGLIKAIDNFDTALDVRFSTYAVPMIAGEVRRFLRDYRTVRVSRSVRDLAYRAMQAREELLSAGEEPTVRQIAEHIGADRGEVVTALESVSDPVSIYEPVYSDAGDTLYLLDQLGDGTDADAWLDEISIKDAISALKQREKDILYLRFFRGRTQVEVAKSIGISQAQVSRIEKSALDSIKQALRTSPDS